MGEKLEKFRPPSRFEHWFNALVALLAKLGITFPDGYRLLVVGRKSGKTRAIAVTVPTIDGKKYLVAPRGETQWVRNVRAAGRAALEKGSKTNFFRVEEITGSAKNAILAEYLRRYHKAVQRYFEIPAGAGAEEFATIADAYPVFALEPTTNSDGDSV